MDATILGVGIALGLGLLVGLQRTWANHPEAGIRTFPLITLFGLLSALLASEFGGWIVAAGAISVAALLLLVNYPLLRNGHQPGITTEVAALVMFAVGALLGIGHTAPAVVVTGITAVLLHWKDPLHGVAERLGARDFEAIIRLVLIALVILPVLPNRDMGPFQVLNPFEIWLMVVLISGISMAGYVGYLLFGARGGALAAGLLGGLISSTATTVSYARRAARVPERSPSAALVIVLASTVVFGRVLVEIVVVAPEFLGAAGPPLAIMMGLLALLSVALFTRTEDSSEEELDDQEPPSDLLAAMAFGGLYAGVLLATAFARQHLGSGALYLVAGVSGLTDLDAITLSTAQLVKGGGLEAGLGWRIVLIGAMSNLVFKAGVVMVVGHRALRRRIFGVFGAALLGGVALLLFWPG